MEPIYKEDRRYKAAMKKVKEIKGFYVHLTVYLFINITIILVSHPGEQLLSALDNFWTYSTAFFWGIGLFGHWASVFGPNVFLGKEWEERKIKELMEKEKKKIWE